jgi:hypothetical protein
LGDVTARAGEGHHVDGVEGVGGAEVFDYFVFEVFGGTIPGVDYFLEAFDFGDFASGVTLFGDPDFFFGCIQERSFGWGNL